MGGKTREVFEYLEDRVEGGTSYLKSKVIGQDLGYSSKEIGPVMATINNAYEDARDGRTDLDANDFPDDLKWGYSSSTSWRIDPIFNDEEIYTAVARRAGIRNTVE